MDLALMTKKVLQLLDEYSLSGALQGQGLNQDYLNRMNNIADDAQKEVAQVKKIHAVHSISQNNIRPQNSDGFKLQQYLTTNQIMYQATGSRAYYFEVDRQGTVLIEEETSPNTWVTIASIAVPNTVTSFTAYKSVVTPSSINNYVRINFTGLYPYNIRNVALFAELFASNSDVPDYTPYVKYEMPDDFYDLERVVQQAPVRQYNEFGDYRWEGRKTFVLPYNYRGGFDIFYYRYPTTITDTTPSTYIFEVDEEAAAAIPYYVAAHIFLTEPTELAGRTATQLINEYNAKLGNFKQTNYDGFMQIYDPAGW